jgi:putative methionine-R-sulfoxide reductase with GAF domain
MRVRSREEQEEDDARFTASLAALALCLFLAWLGLYVLDALAHEARLEDCMMQGRTNCVRVDLTQLRN